MRWSKHRTALALLYSAKVPNMTIFVNTEFTYTWRCMT